LRSCAPFLNGCHVMRTISIGPAQAGLYAAIAMLLAGSPAGAQQATPPPGRTLPAQAAPPTGTPPPIALPSGQRRPERGMAPQGFSVVLVLGDIQGTATPDDVPAAARRALVDMREFLPFKSYKLLDAAWVMCCGLDGRPGARGGSTPTSPSTGAVSQLLRGPDDQEYELKLFTSRGDGSQVFVRFTLFGGAALSETTAASSTQTARQIARKIDDLKDRHAFLEKQIQETKKKVDVGITSGSEIPKLELELRRIEREVAELVTQATESRNARASARPAAESSPRNTVIDTNFAMSVGETVVVGTSRLKGGSRALIALLTAVPPRSATERRE
jgi:hypothetical protein